MTGRPFIGGLLALFVEAFHWVKIRWDFDEGAYATAWKLTLVAILLAGVLIYLDGSPYLALPLLLTWLPVLFLPMQFVQSFGLNNSMPLITFSFLAKHRRQRNLRLGLNESVIHVNFGNIYFVAILIAATLGERSSSMFFLPGIIILTGWALLSATRSRPTSLIVALSIAGGLSIAGQYGIEELENWLGNRGPGRSSFDPNSVSTMIGKPGTIQQSPDIIWRLKPVNGTVMPRLLRTASYNAYRPSSWSIDPPPATIFRDLDVFSHEGKDYHILGLEDDNASPLAAVRASLTRYQVRGAASPESPLSLPGDTASLLGFELDGIEQNSLGTVRIFPKQSVIEGSVLWQGETNPEKPASNEDLVVPHLERETLKAVLKELRLEDQPDLPNKLTVIQSWFFRNFRYTRDLTIRSWTQGFSSPTAMTQFLTTVRAGHCEYFAAATALLLREAGVPTRYATGYSLLERDLQRAEYVIRGTHGHAWCRVWDEQKGLWIDFDTTPPSWGLTVANLNPSMQKFNDALKRLREDFFLWRNRPANRLGVTVVMATITLSVALFVMRRLWKTQRRLEEVKLLNGYDGPVQRTSLNALEKQAEKQLGERPLGKPFGEWISELGPTVAQPDTIAEAVEIHQRARFDPAPIPTADQKRLDELVKEIRAMLKRG